MERKFLACLFLLIVLLNLNDGKNIAILIEPDDNLASELEWLGSDMTDSHSLNAGAWPRPGDARSSHDAWPRPGKREFYGNEMFEKRPFPGQQMQFSWPRPGKKETKEDTWPRPGKRESYSEGDMDSRSGALRRSEEKETNEDEKLENAWPRPGKREFYASRKMDVRPRGGRDSKSHKISKRNSEAISYDEIDMMLREEAWPRPGKRDYHMLSVTRPRGGKDARPRGGKDSLRPRGGKDAKPRGGKDSVRPRGGKKDSWPRPGKDAFVNEINGSRPRGGKDASKWPRPGKKDIK
ncbi:uncharacterized protein [Clytia hemisphaerica]|uniref:uncharacterized protein n=1 Tax=Clytia hemisphaerica TaxID=252671 RepID=UPI0034D6A352|eukprot:TCONS_00068562-protein